MLNSWVALSSLTRRHAHMRCSALHIIAFVAAVLATVFLVLWRTSATAQFAPAFEQAPPAAALAAATLSNCGTDPRRALPGDECVFTGDFLAGALQEAAAGGAPGGGAAPGVHPAATGVLEAEIVARCVADPACAGYIVTRAAPSTACPSGSCYAAPLTPQCPVCASFPAHNGAPHFRLLSSAAGLAPVTSSQQGGPWHTTTTTTYVRQF